MTIPIEIVTALLIAVLCVLGWVLRQVDKMRIAIVVLTQRFDMAIGEAKNKTGTDFLKGR